MPKGRVAFYDLFLGRELEMNDHRAIIVGGLRGDADVPVERRRLHQVFPGQGLRPAGAEGPLLHPRQDRARAGRRPRSAPAIANQTGLKARTSKEFERDTIEYYLKYTGIPINFGITAFLGFFIGTAIAGQTFYNFTLENLRQFGALKAMGATNLRIVGMILLQAAVVGLLGYGLGVGLGALFGVRCSPRAASWRSTPTGTRCPIVGGGDRPDLHPVERRLHPQGDGPRAGDRLPRLIVGSAMRTSGPRWPESKTSARRTLR